MKKRFLFSTLMISLLLLVGCDQTTEPTSATSAAIAQTQAIVMTTTAPPATLEPTTAATVKATQAATAKITEAAEVNTTVPTEIAAEASTEINAETPAEMPTEAIVEVPADAPAAKPAEAIIEPAAPQDSPAVAPAAEQSNEAMVWIPKSGKKYHSNAACSNMKSPSQVTLSKAQALGYTPCSKCY